MLANSGSFDTLFRRIYSVKPTEGLENVYKIFINFLLEANLTLVKKRYAPFYTSEEMTAKNIGMGVWHRQLTECNTSAKGDLVSTYRTILNRTLHFGFGWKSCVQAIHMHIMH